MSTASPEDSDGFTLPSLFEYADAAATLAQKRYLRVASYYLWSLIGGAALTAFSDGRATLRSIGAFAFLLSVGLALLQAIKRYDRTWFTFRGIAESVKSLSWRFAMGAPPYDLSSDAPRQAFLRDLASILSGHATGTTSVTWAGSEPEQLDPRIEAFRSKPAQERARHYLAHRVEDQRRWYSNKAAKNVNSVTRWFWLMVTLHILGASVILLQITGISAQYVPAEVLIVSAGAALTWMQLRQFQWNSASYATASHEIAIIGSLGDHITSDEALAAFISDVESAFSREHTLWIARRDSFLPRRLNT